jgi:glucose 1-dehydrogenase
VSAYPEFRGKRALITGGTQGIGKAIAARLGRNGALLHLNYIGDDQPAEETKSEFQAAGFPVTLHRADLGSTAAVDAMLEEIRLSGQIELLVCNASHQEKQLGFFATDLAAFQRTLDVNVLGNFHLIQQVARELTATQRPGRVVVASSGHANMVFKDTFAYDVSKAALEHLVRAAALDLITHDIHLNAVQIGWTHTPGERRWFTEEEQDRLSRTIPIGRAAQADEIAAVFEFLLSEQAAYVVGSVYNADGGFALRPNHET